MLKYQSTLSAPLPREGAKGPLRVPAGPDTVLRELASLGLTEDASRGILIVLMRRETPPAAIDWDEF